MPFDVTYDKDREILEEDLLESVYLKRVHQKMDSRTLAKHKKNLDAMLDRQVMKKNKLVWTKAGVHLGDSSKEPHDQVESFWADMTTIFGQTKELLKAVGTFYMWRISIRAEEHWLMYRQDLGKVDPDTGKAILVCEYWVNENYIPERPASVLDLISKFNKQKSIRLHP